MSFSLNETEGLIRKAAIGAGWPLGLAVDLGRAVASACSSGENGAAMGRELLEASDGLSRFAALSAWLDTAGEAEIVASENMAIAPALALVIGRDRGGVFAPQNGDLRFSTGDQPQQQSPQRAEIEEDDLAALKALAHKTYVPATAESRLAGAGAGLTDND